jgi:photosystem II stability/assembly factor-like uncharacterized protein
MVGWAVGDQGSIFATDDGGQHWTLRRSSMDGQPELHGVATAKDGHEVWAVGIRTADQPPYERGAILKTDKDGADWAENDVPEAKGLKWCCRHRRWEACLGRRL